MLADPVEGGFQHFSLIQAALVAGGAEPGGSLERYEQKYRAWQAAARRACMSEPSPLARAAALFNFVHLNILTGGYDAAASEPAAIFDSGRFNCESATILLTALAADCGLPVRAIVRPRHAMCVLEIAGQSFDIETTCPNWFNLTADQRRQAAGAAEARASGERPVVRRQVSEAGLVAVIYYNRGIDLLHDGRFAEAVSANVRALRLDPQNEAAAGNLLASINNWSLMLASQGQFARAIALVTAGLTAAPGHEPFRVNRRHIYRIWIEALAASGHEQEALAVLAAARHDDPGSPLWSVWAVRLTRQESGRN